MAHPTARMLAVLELLQTHGRMRGPELARRLDVDVRTVRRYIAVLEDIGIPITTERGRHGAYMLVTGFKLPPMMFTDDESLAVSLGLHAARSLGLAEAAPAVASAQAKLERVMPANLKSRVRAVSETAMLDLSAGTAPNDNGALVAMMTAAQARRRTSIRYRSMNGETSERDFDPYGLVYREGHWYVSGHCHLRRDLRSFRLDRIQAVLLLEATFERPADFNALEHVIAGIAAIPRAVAVDVLLFADMDAARESLSANIGFLEPVAAGVRLRARTDSIEWFARQLARLPFAFDIRAPDELRAALCRHAQGLLERHGNEP